MTPVTSFRVKTYRLPWKIGTCHCLVGPHLLDLSEEHAPLARNETMLFLGEEVVPLLVGEEYTFSGRALGLSEGCGIVVRIDVVGIPAQKIGGHLLVVELLFVGCPFGALYRHLYEGGLLELGLRTSPRLTSVSP